jgi:hypothetical protein
MNAAYSVFVFLIIVICLCIYSVKGVKNIDKKFETVHPEAVQVNII